jgi:hypothetical protein
MLDLVLWSSLLALAPWALGLAMSAPSLLRLGSVASHTRDGLAWSPDRPRSNPAPS